MPSSLREVTPGLLRLWPTSFMSGYELPWGQIMATGTLVALPVIVFSMIVCGNRPSLTAGAIKYSCSRWLTCHLGQTETLCPRGWRGFRWLVVQRSYTALELHARLRRTGKYGSREDEAYSCWTM